MLTKLHIRNFKRFEDVEIELGQTVVFIGPNNSGKTTALQALALWYAGMTRIGWEELTNPNVANGRIGKTIVLNRLDLTSIPIPNAQSLWHNLQVQNNQSVPIDIHIEGVTNSNEWSMELQFAYANEESINCTLLPPETGNYYDFTLGMNVLPSMSGLSVIEDRLEEGSIRRRIGEGRTSEVLRNLCFLLYEANGKLGYWDQIISQISSRFGVELLPPQYDPSRGEIRMSYKTRAGFTLDLSAAGRGMLQVLLLLAYMYNNPGAVLLLDEPDAHLEILRQREIYQLLTTVGREQNSQIIIASHSEVIMNEAADRDVLVAFVGKPHRIDDRSRKSQVLKALKEIGFEQYYQAELKGWVLYLEGATDLAILRAFANTLKHDAAAILDRAFVNYVANQPQKARHHFQGLKEAKRDLVGIALFDQLDRQLQENTSLSEIMWKRREIENYLAFPETLTAYAQQGSEDAEHRVAIMRRLVERRIPPAALEDRSDPFWINTKMSDDFLDLIFEQYFRELNLPNLLTKTDYHVLANYVPRELIDPEVTEKLDAIVAVAKRAQPRED